ncbi:MAG: DUF2442 domain-containing protein [Bacteroidales bacterium]|nr:DUF2442 domain-containing protein [Bacteroidales bacterium]MBQ9253574.1 DUF2442 domain-containing protein [Bacteroidales bacterium]
MNTSINKENIKDIILSSKSITIITLSGEKYSQSLEFYPYLERATKEEKDNFNISILGLHWPNLDTDISFESFFYDFSKPFLYHR